MFMVIFMVMFVVMFVWNRSVELISSMDEIALMLIYCDKQPVVRPNRNKPILNRKAKTPRDYSKIDMGDMDMNMDIDTEVSSPLLCSY